jgi:L-alanine-DL-glutamate epimerase-like enolase superfamily enzyme
VSVTRQLDHYGFSILLVDLGGRDRAQMLERISAMRTAVSACAPGSALVLTDCTKSFLDEEVIRALGEAVAANKPFVRASAVIGLSPKREEVRQLIAGMAAREISSFDDVEPAMDWLAEQGRAAGGA